MERESEQRWLADPVLIFVLMKFAGNNGSQYETLVRFTAASVQISLCGHFSSLSLALKIVSSRTNRVSLVEGVQEFRS